MLKLCALYFFHIGASPLALWLWDETRAQGGCVRSVVRLRHMSSAFMHDTLGGCRNFHLSPADASSLSTEAWTGLDASIQQRVFVVPPWWLKNWSTHQVIQLTSAAEEFIQPSPGSVPNKKEGDLLVHRLTGPAPILRLYPFHETARWPNLRLMQ